MQIGFFSRLLSGLYLHFSSLLELLCTVPSITCFSVFIQYIYQHIYSVVQEQIFKWNCLRKIILYVVLHFDDKPEFANETLQEKNVLTTVYTLSFILLTFAQLDPSKEIFFINLVFAYLCFAWNLWLTVWLHLPIFTGYKGIILKAICW